MNGLSRRLSTIDLTVLEKPIHPININTPIMFQIDRPNTITKTINKGRPGSTRRKSANRISPSSTKPRKYPARRPTKSPINTENIAVRSPIMKEILVPYMSIVKRSLGDPFGIDEVPSNPNALPYCIICKLSIYNV